MDTLFSAAWFDDEQKEGAEAKPATAARRAPAVRARPDPLVLAVAGLAGLGALGFAFVSLVMTAAVAYLWTL
jgi:hypothetical protein